MEQNELSSKNKNQWDRLYGDTNNLVWGDTPVGFIKEFAGDMSVNLTEQSMLLDAACGEGRNIPAIKEMPGRLTVCDYSKHALQKMPAHLKEKVLRIRCDLSELPFMEESFDLVIAVDIIETLPEPEPAIHEIYRVLKEGALFLCNIPGMEDTISEKDMTPLGKDEYLYQDKYFFRFVTEEAATALLKKCGFEIIKSKDCEWWEKDHEGFRDGEHMHRSHVFLAKKIKK